VVGQEHLGGTVFDQCGIPDHDDDVRVADRASPRVRGERARGLFRCIGRLVMPLPAQFRSWGDSHQGCSYWSDRSPSAAPLSTHSPVGDPRTSRRTRLDSRPRPLVCSWSAHSPSPLG